MKNMTKNGAVFCIASIVVLVLSACISTESGPQQRQPQQQQEQQQPRVPGGPWRAHPPGDPAQVQQTREKIRQARSLMNRNDVHDIGYIWMMPRGDTLKDLTTRLDEWPQTRALVDIIGFADHVLNRLYSDEELSQSFAVLNRIGLPLAMEVGAVKEWAIDGEAAFFAQKPMWDRFIRLGATIAGIVMDEPLVAVMNATRFTFLETERERFDFAVEETVTFMRLVREHYPRWFIADIEVYPHFDADLNIQWVDALESRLIDEGIRGQDFYRMDVDWNSIPRINTADWEHGWREVKRIEDHCRSLGLPFSMIYWAADAGASARIRMTPSRWLEGIMRMGEAYETAGGRPDQFDIQTWIAEFPPVALPETEEFTFTHSVLEFNQRFIPAR